MKKHLIVTMMAVLLIAVGLSGCNEKSNENNEIDERLIGT